MQIVRPEARYDRHRTSIKDVGGKEIWTRELVELSSPAAENEITMRVPASLFAGRDYILEITGRSGNGEPESLDYYSFRVIKK